jgi:hypothetical protein
MPSSRGKWLDRLPLSRSSRRSAEGQAQWRIPARAFHEQGAGRAPVPLGPSSTMSHNLPGNLMAGTRRTAGRSGSRRRRRASSSAKSLGQKLAHAAAQFCRWMRVCPPGEIGLLAPKYLTRASRSTMPVLPSVPSRKTVKPSPPSARKRFTVTRYVWMG